MLARGVRICAVVAVVLLLANVRAQAEEPATFDVDVMAVLSKAGCNAGTCHGNLNGKGGFRLSLRGQDNQFDYDAITRDFASRRIDRLAPESSLLLSKPSGGVAHLGGVRFRGDSAAYSVLRNWIAAGAPPPNDNAPRLTQLEVAPRQAVVVEPQTELQLTVTAHFSDGQHRDVSDMAVYETGSSIVQVSPSGLVQRRQLGETTILVRYLDRQAPVQLAFVPRRADFVWADPAENSYIDRLVYAKLRTLRINPSPPADDHTFVRRAYLDAIGILPTAAEVRSFVADTSADKRARLVDHLLSRSEFADLWALKWSDLLRNEEKVLDERGVEVFYGWIHDSMASGKPIDQFVRELVTARGSSYDVPPANYYRANRDPLTRAETTARLFLGTRLACAKCHNHPFERWTQDDYYSWAAVFARIDYEIVKNDRQDKYDKNEFIGEQIVLVKDQGEVQNARTGDDAAPRLLGAEPLDDASQGDRLDPLGQWLTSPANELFAKSQANLIWFHLLGRGLVEPIDDFRATNPGVNPPLLDALAEDFAAHKFDLRQLVRRIMNSRVYQLSSQPNATNAGDQENFSRAIVRRLTAEQLLDAQCQALDVPAAFGGYPLGMRAGQVPGVRKLRRRDHDAQLEGDRFLRTFGKPDRLLACQCERSAETTLAQAFTLISGDGLNNRLARRGGLLDRLAHSKAPPRESVAQLYYAALSRPPTAAETAAAVELIESSGDRFTALQDIAWALLNAKEFIFRR